MEAIEFHNDKEYLAWTSKNPRGYVFNIPKSGADAETVFLHRANCYTVNNQNKEAGGFTERYFRKICAEKSAELKAWLTAELGFSDHCTCSKCLG